MANHSGMPGQAFMGKAENHQQDTVKWRGRSIHLDKEKLNQREQRVLKRLDMGYRIFSNCVIWGTLLVAVYMLVMAVYYETGEFGGAFGRERGSDYFGGFVIFGTGGGSALLLKIILNAVVERQMKFDPRKMSLPHKGTVTLEAALNRMTVNLSVIMWDMIFGMLLGFMVLLMVCLGGNIPRILLACFILAAFLGGGHVFWSRRWKNRPIVEQMLQNTSEYISISARDQFVLDLEKSLLKGVLYYGRELILTEEFIIGVTEKNLKLFPAAIPRAEIAELVFFSRKTVVNRYRRNERGILDCRLHLGKSAELSLGQGASMLRVLKVFNFYEIPWKDEDTVYE